MSPTRPRERLSDYLSELKNPFPKSHALLDEISTALQHTHPLPQASSSPSPGSGPWDTVEQLLKQIERVEEATIHVRTTARKCAVTIGRNRPNTPSEPARPTDHSIHQMTDEINYCIRRCGIAGAPPPPSRTCSNPTLPRAPFRTTRFSSMEGLRATQILSSMIEENESPQERLLHVFARHQRATVKRTNALTQYIRESTVQGTSSTSMRYKDRDTIYQLQKAQQSFLSAVPTQYQLNQTAKTRNKYDVDADAWDDESPEVAASPPSSVSLPSPSSPEQQQQQDQPDSTQEGDASGQPAWNESDLTDTAAQRQRRALSPSDATNRPKRARPAKKSWFTMGATNRGRSFNYLSLTRRDPGKSRERTLKHLQKNRILLDKEFLLCGMRIREYRLAEKEHRKSSQQTLQQLRTYYQQDLVRAFHTYVVFKLLKIRLQVHYHDCRSQIIEDAAKHLKKLLRKQAAMADEPEDEEKEPIQVPSPDVLCNTPSMQEILELLKLRQRQQKRAHKRYQALVKNQTALCAPEYRTRTLCDLLACLSLHSEVQTFYPYEWMEQQVIDSVLLDQRCRTGMRITKLEEAIAGTETDEIPPHEVVDLVQTLVDQTAAELTVPDTHLPQLRLAMRRSIFPLLFPYLWPLQKALHERQDRQFEFQQRVLRSIPLHVIDPKLAGYEHDSSCFAEAISILEDLVFQNVPSDMLMLLYRVMECVHKIARLHSGGDLGADDLFPLWINITIQAEVPSLHSHLHYMEQFATPEENITQLGYCLTTFQACVSHIRCVDLEQFAG